MQSLTARSLMVCLFGAVLVASAGCPGGGGIPGRGGGSVDPDKCGNYADASDAGRKLKALLEATAKLEAAAKSAEVEVRTGCDAMAKELGVSPKGDTRAVCNAVLAQIKEDLSAGIQAEARLSIDYKPAVCTIDVQAAASVAAQCEASAGADVSVTCEGGCSGTCSGTCEGKCAGGTAGGQCNGECDGVCRGECSGGCSGTADVHASAECEAKAEVYASADVRCEPAELRVEAEASMVVDKPRADRAIAALRAGLPRILTVQARMVPLKAAFEGWAKTARATAQAGKDLAGQFKDQAICISGQLAAMGSAIANVEASINVSVEVSVEASGTAQVGG
jgi:hypothetical protein